jgi:hypothetical protein
MKIQLTSKKQGSLLKAVAVESEREIEEDSNWPANAEEAAKVAQLLATPLTIDAEAEKKANELAAQLQFNG